jgi:hypothetical protein
VNPCFYGHDTCEGLTGPRDMMCDKCRRDDIERVAERAEYLRDDFRETT